MSVPSGKKDQAVFHLILSEMHRLHALMLNMQTLDDPETEQALREHFTREQNMALGKLIEWKNHRPELYRRATEEFQSRLRAGGSGDSSDGDSAPTSTT